MKTQIRYEETLIAEMRAAGLLVTEAVEEQVYVEVFNGKPRQKFNALELFAACKKAVGREIEAETKPLPGEIS